MTSEALKVLEVLLNSVDMDMALMSYDTINGTALLSQWETLQNEMSGSLYNAAFVPEVESVDMKAIARRIDPDCWVSYSGKTRQFKQSMDKRRSAAMAKAAAE